MTGTIVVLAQAGAGLGGLGGTDLTSIVGLLNYGVLGILTIGFVRGWVVSPRERDRLADDLKAARDDLDARDVEIARLNDLMLKQLQAMVATTDKQLDLWAAQQQQAPAPPRRRGPSV